MQSPTPRRRATPTQAAMREYRILGWLKDGLSTEEIAGLEGVSRSRARELAAEALSARDRDLELDPRQLAELRLAPALQLAARKIAEGELGGVDRMVKVIERLLKLRSETRRGDSENVRAKLLAKLNLNPEPFGPAQAAAEMTRKSPPSL